MVSEHAIAAEKRALFGIYKSGGLTSSENKGNCNKIVFSVKEWNAKKLVYLSIFSNLLFFNLNKFNGI